MFVLKASAWMATIKQFVPTILHAIRTACGVRKTDAAYLDPGKAVFEATLLSSGLRRHGTLHQ